MSLLDRGNEDILVYQEEVWTDTDGNVMTRAGSVGEPARAMIQLRAQSGTSARRAEQDNEGFETESVYRMRLTRADETRLGPLGAQAQIEWRGERWVVIGDAQIFNSSPRTAHHDYTIRRT
jgi:hypothetical protein